MTNNELKKLLVQFQKDTLEEWDRPTGKNVDMVKLAYKFADIIQSHIDEQVREVKKQGFYMACGLCGVEADRVEELWNKCLLELTTNMEKK